MQSYIGAIYRHGDKVAFVGEKALLKVQMKRLDMLAETRMLDVPSEASCWLLEDLCIQAGASKYTEPRSVCRRLQLLKRWSLHERYDDRIRTGVREREVRMVLHHEHYHPSQRAAVVPIPETIGCAPETLHE